jgi:hypothetical protein
MPALRPGMPPDGHATWRTHHRTIRGARVKTSVGVRRMWFVVWKTLADKPPLVPVRE